MSDSMPEHSQTAAELSAAGWGTVVAVRGSVVDARFVDRLPDVKSELRAGENFGVVVEVL